jgi:hypothetical protein
MILRADGVPARGPGDRVEAAGGVKLVPGSREESVT